MSTDSVIEIEPLIAPFEGDTPTGPELSLVDFDSPLLTVKDLWDEARKLVKEKADCERSGGIDSQGQQWRTIPNPDWNSVIDSAERILKSQSKDFRVAAYLTEALLRKHHAEGLRDGLKICWGLCENFWNDLHPQANADDGHSVRVGPFAGVVNEAGFSAIDEIPVVKGQKHGEREPRQYTARDFFRSKDLEQITNPADRESLIEQGYITQDEFMSVAAVTDKQFFRDLIETIDESIALVSTLGNFLRENCQDDQYDEPTWPGVTPFREKLESVRKLVTELLGGEESEEEVQEEGGSGSGEGNAREGLTRDSAFGQIERIAQFFERTEPHTPVHFALRQAIRWGRMPLHDLLRELIEDHGTLEQLRKVVGLPKQEED